MGVITNFPSAVGVCLPVPSPPNGCASQTDVGNPCGGYLGLYTDALGYTCASIGAGASDVACVPAYDPPVAGIGTLETGTNGTPL